eukprot:scaffold6942_cov72-Phaeocystis_antarctica.AAC.12
MLNAQLASLVGKARGGVGRSREISVVLRTTGQGRGLTTHRITCKECLARQRTCECGNVAARLHSDMRRQPSARAHCAAGTYVNRPPFELTVAR